VIYTSLLYYDKWAYSCEIIQIIIAWNNYDGFPHMSFCIFSKNHVHILRIIPWGQVLITSKFFFMSHLWSQVTEVATKEIMA
jgi:hypothetical protein